MKAKRGDTIIEVLFAFAILSLVVILSISSMNNGVANAQSNLEASMARSEIDAQAEAIRFIHEAYITSLNESGSKTSQYAKIWEDLTKSTSEPIDFSTVSCDAVGTALNNAFVINIRNLASADASKVVVKGKFKSADIYPRLVYSDSEYFANYTSVFERGNSTNVIHNEGIWDTVQKVENGWEITIQVCWTSTGRKEPVTLDTVIRLYDLGSS